MDTPLETPRRPSRRGAVRLGLGIAALALLLEAYVRWPSQIAAPAIDPATDAAALILLVHGSFGQDEPDLLALAARLRALTAGEAGVDVRRYVWSPYSDNILRAAAHGARIGAALGERLGQRRGLRQLHLIAHSAGAYVLEPLCESARRAHRDAPIFVRMTFLDPIGLRGAWDRGHGARHFGRCADLAAVYYSTDDPAPATDRPFLHARNFDVTMASGRAQYQRGGHRWPIRHYADHLTRTEVLRPPDAER
jgi:hypothetical protein